MWTHGEFRIATIGYDEYLAACARLEGLIFGDYFGFDWKTLREGRTPPPNSPRERFCLGVFRGEEIVGWHYSHSVDDGVLLMRDTGLLPDCQGRGIYTFMLPLIVKHAQEAGYERIWSHHRMTNNRVIVPKLKSGFFINGVVADDYGMAVQLIYALVPEYRECLRVRSGEIKPVGDLGRLMGLGQR
ncbi:MAG TPA: GNAT family N-acetyltransferase [Opitutaceae bacterium]|jgi:hypothetical protein